MRKSIRHSLAVMAAVLGLGQALGQAQNVIDVDIFNTGEIKAIPVHIEGFTGDVLSLLKFDLFVQGFEFVERSKAQFTIKGSNKFIFDTRCRIFSPIIRVFHIFKLLQSITRRLYVFIQYIPFTEHIFDFFTSIIPIHNS